MERKKNEALGRPMLTKKVDMSVFVRTLVYEVRTVAQSVAGALLVQLPLHGPEQMQVQVLVQVPKPPPLPEMVLLVELVPVSEQVPVSMPDPPVDQPDDAVGAQSSAGSNRAAAAVSARATSGARSMRDNGDRVWSAMISFLT